MKLRAWWMAWVVVGSLCLPLAACAPPPRAPIASEGAADREAWSALYDSGNRAFEEGDVARAEHLLRRALDSSKAFGNSDPRRIRSLGALGRVIMREGRYREALPLYRETLHATEDVLGTEDEALVAILLTMAQVYRLDEDPVSAEPLYRRSLKILIKSEGTQSRSLIPPYLGLGAVLREQGRDEEAHVFEVRAERLQAEFPGSSG